MMKNIMLIVITLMFFAFVYYIMKKIDEFIYENRYHIVSDGRKNKTHIWIAAEIPLFLDSISPALENCSTVYPHINFFLSSGKAKHLLQRLLNETLDIVLLSQEAAENLSEEYSSIRIPYQKDHSIIKGRKLTEKNTCSEENWIYVVWKKNTISKDRDRAIFAIENEHYRLKCGYCDYYE